MEKTFTEQMQELLVSQKREILEALAATNEEFRAIVAEMDPKDVADVYPSAPILRRMNQAGLRLTLGDDAHAPEHLGAFQGAAIAAAKAAGYRSLWYMDAPGSWKEIGIDEL